MVSYRVVLHEDDAAVERWEQQRNRGQATREGVRNVLTASSDVHGVWCVLWGGVSDVMLRGLLRWSLLGSRLPPDKEVLRARGAALPPTSSCPTLASFTTVGGCDDVVSHDIRQSPSTEPMLRR